MIKIVRKWRHGAKLKGHIYCKSIQTRHLQAAVSQCHPDSISVINESQYFDGVRPEVWEFCVGGYQVCEKWLKDRRGGI